MIDKSLRMKVPKQGGVKNYLGKQKMVTAPKKWKSAPNHPDTELAYITKAEKDALIKMNLHGSMNGKAHKGPSGIISLNGWGDADRGYSSPSHDHGGGEGWQTYAIEPAPAPVDYSSLDNEEQQAVDRGEPTAQMTPTERNEQGHGPGGTNNPDYKQKQYEITGDIDELSDFTGIDTRPKIDIADIHGETDDPSSVSYDPTYIPAAQAAATRKAIAESSPSFFDSGIIPTKLPDPSGIKQFITEPQTGWKKAAKGVLGALSFGMFPGLSSMYYQGKALKAAGDKLGLTKNLTKPREINPLDEFGYKGNVYAKKPTVHKDDHGAADAGQMVPESLKSTVSEGTQMFLTDEQREQYRLAQNKMKAALAEGFYIDKDGKHIDLSEEQINALTQWITRIDDLTRQTEQQVMRAADGGRVDKALGGRVRDI